ncbi:MAG: RNA pseudouridine synthase [Treponema sp.]|jgi:RluA family pseudouridine synthase|nr:RNA pseudouridine synthase [Treponema sp.]
MKAAAPFTIIYEDDRIIAVNKAAGISVGGDRWDGACERLDKLIEARYSGRIFTVHRIDRDTSGVVVFARDPETHKRLSAAFENRQVIKRYIAVIHGRPSWKETVCDLPLVPDGDKLHRTIIDKYHGKKALTRFRIAGSAGNYTVAEALPETGRTHQIRVHLASLGHPIVCDALYGAIARRGGSEKGVFLSSFKKGWRGNSVNERALLFRLGLHAARLSLPDYTERDCPAGRKDAATDANPPALPRPDAAGNADRGLSFYAPPARDIGALISQLEKCGGFTLHSC